MAVHFTPKEYCDPYQRLVEMTSQYGSEGLHDKEILPVQF